jgi:acetyl-CoA carboxylase carboxyl transferase subunit alpha
LATYLDFEQNICQIQEDIIAAEIRYDYHAVEILKGDLEKEVTKTYANLSSYQELQLARHQDRPYAIDYINLLLDKKYDLHADRHFSDDLDIDC